MRFVDDVGHHRHTPLTMLVISSHAIVIFLVLCRLLSYASSPTLSANWHQRPHCLMMLISPQGFDVDDNLSLYSVYDVGSHRRGQILPIILVSNATSSTMSISHIFSSMSLCNYFQPIDNVNELNPMSVLVLDPNWCGKLATTLLITFDSSFLKIHQPIKKINPLVDRLPCVWCRWQQKRSLTKMSFVDMPSLVQC